MLRHFHTPWGILCVGILGLIAGYLLLLSQRGGLSAFAESLQCPAPKQLCQGTGCAGNGSV